jgi:hypothetical protein
MAKAKSFYIFDFDDNIMHTGSETYVYHKDSGEEVALSSLEYIKERLFVGRSGAFKDYVIDPTPHRSFRNFNDDPDRGHFPFIDDVKRALSTNSWRGPSWDRFEKAVSRHRTIAIITARGHHPDRIREGIEWLTTQGHLPHSPEIHSVYAVTSSITKEELRWTGPDLISPLKKQALHHFIEAAYNEFGHKPDHRFGFSDDDPNNIVHTRQKFFDLKQRNPHHSFFLYEAHAQGTREEEVLFSHNETH